MEVLGQMAACTYGDIEALAVSRGSGLKNPAHDNSQNVTPCYATVPVNDARGWCVKRRRH